MPRRGDRRFPRARPRSRSSQGEGESWPLPMLEKLQNDSSKKIAPFVSRATSTSATNRPRQDLADRRRRLRVGRIAADLGRTGDREEARPVDRVRAVRLRRGSRSRSRSTSTTARRPRPEHEAHRRRRSPRSSRTRSPSGQTTEILGENGPDPAGGGLDNAEAPGDPHGDSARQFVVDGRPDRVLPLRSRGADDLEHVRDESLLAGRHPARLAGPPRPSNSNLGIISGSKGVDRHDDAARIRRRASGFRASTTHHIAYLAPAWTTKYGAPRSCPIQNKAGHSSLRLRPACRRRSIRRPRSTRRRTSSRSTSARSPTPPRTRSRWSSTSRCRPTD